MLLRPWGLPEAIWPLLGSLLLIALPLVSWSSAAAAVLQGWNVYLFLAGMMLLAEMARETGLFTWLAAQAAHHARGSGSRLFSWTFGAAILVTAFLSNDATAIVLTPAVYAVAREAQADPLPYLFICAFVANAASFLLPFSNPANLLFFGPGLLRLGPWLRQFAVPSAVALGATYGLLRWHQRRRLATASAPDTRHDLTGRGRRCALGLGLTAAAMIAASIGGWPLGVVSMAAAAGVLLATGMAPGRPVRQLAWGILALVAGFYIWVDALSQTGALAWLSSVLITASSSSHVAAPIAAGFITALACNLVNNLPIALVAGAAGVHATATVRAILQIAVDLGPNFSIAGSLATLLWLAQIRREGETVTGAQFLRAGLMVTLPTLLACFATALAFRP